MTSAWLGWFPVLFYTTIYVGELHKRASPPPANSEAALALDSEATRLGSRALFYSSILSLFVNVTLPFFVREAAKQSHIGSSAMAKSNWLNIVLNRCQIRLVSLWAASHALFVACMFGTL